MLHGLDVAVVLVNHLQPFHLILTVDGVKVGSQAQRDVFGCGQLLAELGNAAQMILKVDDGQMLG